MTDAEANILARDWLGFGAFARRVRPAPHAEGHPGNAGGFAIGVERPWTLQVEWHSIGRTWEEAFHRLDPKRWKAARIKTGAAKRSGFGGSMKAVLADARKRGLKVIEGRRR